MVSGPIRCTQNPTQGEEWKRDWHPESIQAAASDDAVLVVGAGPAGLECAMQLANRGYQVTLAEAGNSLGGRVTLESQLPGLASYARVRDYRESQLIANTNVQIYKGNKLSAEDILELEIPHVIIATGSSWHSDGVGHQHGYKIEGIDSVKVLTADDILSGSKAQGRVLIYDDDHYYMGGAIAELCRQQGLDVCLLTPDSKVSSWTENTLEQEKIQSRLLSLGVEIIVSHEISSLSAGVAKLANIYDANQKREVEFDTLIPLTSRQSNDELYQALLKHEDRFKTLENIGDCKAPGTVAAAVYDGHLSARNLESTVDYYEPLFRREMPGLD
jgi:dimethylamine/trimethylamine dehydrogenase